MLLNDEWVNSEVRGEIKRDLEKNDNENTTVQNLWDAGKATLRGKFIALQTYVKKKEKERKKERKRKKSSNKQSNFTLKGTKKSTINKAQDTSFY